MRCGGGYVCFWMRAWGVRDDDVGGSGSLIHKPTGEDQIQKFEHPTSRRYPGSDDRLFCSILCVPLEILYREGNNEQALAHEKVRHEALTSVGWENGVTSFRCSGRVANLQALRGKSARSPEAKKRGPRGAIGS